MVQKCSIIKVLEIFFVEPTSIHFIKEISRKINLAPTSVRVHIADLFKCNVIIKEKSKPFDGYVANRENTMFLYYKRAYNLITLKELQEKLTEELHPKTIVVFGSYSLGEDIELSDIDIFIVSKIEKEIDLGKFEKALKRKIRVITIDNLSKVNHKIQKKVMNGFALYGGF